MIWPARKPGELFQPEVFWREHCTWLEGSGYTLRPRYHPDWVPSWTNTSKSWATAEDGQPPLVRSRMPISRWSILMYLRLFTSSTRYASQTEPWSC